ncbi:MAG: hypothetical protein ACKV0T_12915 [Planctomycetales bacterium]
MSNLLALERQGELPAPPALHGGDQLTQAEFHRRYLVYPKEVRFELVEGVPHDRTTACSGSPSSRLPRDRGIAPAGERGSVAG